MNSKKIFEFALGLTSPWFVERLEFAAKESGNKQLEIYLDFEKGARFKDNRGVDCPVHDTLERSWQHLNFFEHRCFLHARVPRIKTSTGKIQQVGVPWARPGSGFTLLFEAFAMCLLENEMPVNKAAALLAVYPQRLWTVFNYWIQRAFCKDDQHSVKKIGIDETSRKKGHDYVTVVADLDARRVLFATPGKNETTVDRFKQHLVSKNVEVEQIECVSIDMSPAFIPGVSRNFPEAKIVFDPFHIVQLLNEAMAFLAYWCDLVEEARIPAFNKFVNTIKSHWTGIVNYTESKISNGILEGINSKIQLAKRRARGYRNTNNLINMIYFIAGKLDFDYLHKFI